LKLPAVSSTVAIVCLLAFDTRRGIDKERAVDIPVRLIPGPLGRINPN